MNKNRLEAFSDGVLAIVLTIMVLELHAPHGTDWPALQALLPTFLSYVLSFLYVGIYWNNHHHMLHAVERVSGLAMWANLHLLFWLSLFPLATVWMGENCRASAPTALYGGVLLMAALAYVLLQNALIRNHGSEALLARAVGHDGKGKLSLLLYALGMALSFVQPVLAQVLYVSVAAMWLVPDRRIESLIED